MEERKLRGILSQFKSMKEEADELMQKAWSLDGLLSKIVQTPYHQFDEEENVGKRLKKVHREARALIESYNSSIYDTNKAIDITLRAITLTEDAEPALHQLIVECNKVIGALEEDAASLSSEQIDKLNHLKDEVVGVCKNLDIHFEKNINISLKELEKGHFLASVLITSRVVDHILKQIKGEKIEDKINSLIESGAIEQSRTVRQQQTEKISRLTRNLYNHRIDMYAEPSDALSLLSDSLSLLKIYARTIDK